MSDRRTGKIARLPKELRDEVNRMLRDGVTYATISGFLKDKGYPDINAQNFTNWFEGGHQDWLKEESRLEDMRIRREFAMKIVEENEGSKIHEASLQIAASQIYEVLNDLDPKTIIEKLKGNPEQYSRLINALAKLSDGGLKYERYKTEVAERKERIAIELGRAKNKGGITPETLAKIEAELNLL